MRLHAVIVIAVLSAFLYSALVAAPEIGHHIPSAQSANELVIDVAGVGDDAENKAVPGVNCHIGHSCLALIIPSSSLVLVIGIGSPERQYDPHFTPSGVRYLLFQPPRFLSQV